MAIDSVLMDKFLMSHSKGDKRPRSMSSPESVVQDLKRSSADNERLLSSMEEMMKRLLDERVNKLATKEDLASATSVLTTLIEENRVLKYEVEQLRKENTNIMGRIVDLENRSRRNNLIFKGLKYKEGNDCREVIESFCKNVLGCERQLQLNRVHPLGRRRDNAPIIVHFPVDNDIQCILKNTPKLKGTKMVVHQDFAVETRKKRGMFLALRKEIFKAVGKKNMSLNVEQFIVEGQRFSWSSDMKLRSGSEDGVQKLKEMFNFDFDEIVKDIVKGKRSE